MELPGGPVIKNLPSNAGDTDSISGWGTEILHQGDLVHATTRESSHAPRRTHTHTNVGLKCKFNPVVNPSLAIHHLRKQSRNSLMVQWL